LAGAAHHRAPGGTVRRIVPLALAMPCSRGCELADSVGLVADFLVGVRHGAADRVVLEKAGLRLVVFETFEHFGEDPHRHYVCVAADDESEARASIIAALGWNEVALTDVVARPAPRPCEDYSTAQQVHVVACAPRPTTDGPAGSPWVGAAAVRSDHSGPPARGWSGPDCRPTPEAASRGPGCPCAAG
jgi:hypothetical protein